jgi:hypothetical protein
MGFWRGTGRLNFLPQVIGAQWELRCPLARTDQSFGHSDVFVRAHIDRVFPRLTLLQAAFRTRTGSSCSGRQDRVGRGKSLIR